MAGKQINWMADDEYAAMVELVRHGKVTPLVDVIASRLADGKKIHTEALEALRSLDRWDGGLDCYIKPLPKSSRVKRNAGRPTNAERDQFYHFRRNLLILTISKICYECIENGETQLPTKSELTRRILADQDTANITGFAKLGRTRRYELIDELYAEKYNEKYPAGKSLN